MGSSFWGFEKTEKFAKKARDKGSTPLDTFFSNLVLAHINFQHVADDPEHAKLESGRDYFRKAIASLQTSDGSDAGQYFIGEGYGLWAIHEAFLKNEKESKQQRNFADVAWSKLPNHSESVAQLDQQIKAAIAGVRPTIACWFRSEGVPETFYIVKAPAIASIPPLPASAPFRRPHRPPPLKSQKNRKRAGRPAASLRMEDSRVIQGVGQTLDAGGTGKGARPDATLLVAPPAIARAVPTARQTPAALPGGELEP